MKTGNRSTRNLKKEVFKTCKNAINLTLGSFNGVRGIWYETEHAYHREFIKA